MLDRIFPVLSLCLQVAGWFKLESAVDLSILVASQKPGAGAGTVAAFRDTL